MILIYRRPAKTPAIMVLVGNVCSVVSTAITIIVIKNRFAFSMAHGRHTNPFWELWNNDNCSAAEPWAIQPPISTVPVQRAAGVRFVNSTLPLPVTMLVFQVIMVSWLVRWLVRVPTRIWRHPHLAPVDGTLVSIGYNINSKSTYIVTKVTPTICTPANPVPPVHQVHFRSHLPHCMERRWNRLCASPVGLTLTLMVGSSHVTIARCHQPFRHPPLLCHRLHNQHLLLLPLTLPVYVLHFAPAGWNRAGTTHLLP